MEVIKRKNGIRYREKIYSNGRELKSPPFARKSDAKAWKSRKETEKNFALSYGGDVESDKLVKHLRFREFGDLWIDAIEARLEPKTFKNYKSIFRRHILAGMENVYLRDIKAAHADKIVKRLRPKHNAKGINMILGIFKQVMIMALKEEHITKNPLGDYKQLKEGPRDEDYLSKEEIYDFLTTNRDDKNYGLYLLALNTGMRRGELAGLCWDKVCFVTEQIEVARTRDYDGLRNSTKSGLKRAVPMNDDVRSYLKNIFDQKINRKYVLCDHDGEPFKVHHMYRHYDKAQKRAGLQQHFRFHDLRHTFASHFMMNGGNIYDLQKILGHSKLEMTMRYAHLAPDHLRSAINIVSFNGDKSGARVLSLENRKVV